MLAFESARASVVAAVDIQRAAAVGPFAVRVGIHTGETIRTVDDVRGLTVSKAARIASAAGAGQVMASSTTRDMVGSRDGVHVGEPEIVALKGFADTHQIVLLDWE